MIASVFDKITNDGSMGEPPAAVAAPPQEPRNWTVKLLFGADDSVSISEDQQTKVLRSLSTYSPVVGRDSAGLVLTISAVGGREQASEFAVIEASSALRGAGINSKLVAVSMISNEHLDWCLAQGIPIWTWARRQSMSPSNMRKRYARFLPTL
jgi:hypothetical protein